MKTIIVKSSGDIKRLSNEEAARLVASGKGEYAPKSMFKRKQLMERVAKDGEGTKVK